MNRTEISHTCPHCQSEHELTSNLMGKEGGGPSPGDASICITCCEFSVFQDDLSLRKPNEEEAKALDTPKIKRAQQVAREMVKRHRTLQ